MKNRLLSVVLVSICTLIALNESFICESRVGAADEEGVQINADNFPDSSFRTFIMQFDDNSDGWLSDDETSIIEYMSCENRMISSLKGIEYFTSLNCLICTHNELTTLDLSSNTELSYLKCDNNHLKELDLSKNTKLKQLFVQDNQLTSLKLENNDALMQIICYNNKIQSMQINHCSQMEYLCSVAEYKDNGQYYSLCVSVGIDQQFYLAFDYNCEIQVAFPKDGSIGDFVERLYTVALNRDSELGGKKYWVNEITNGNKTGADCGLFFLTSAEFNNRKLSIEDFVETLYKTFFGRESESAGKKYWVGELKNKSKSREDVIRGFIDSAEWCNICADYGVKSGAPTAKAEHASQAAIDFATRLYTCCLGRNPEKGGLQFWSLALTNLEQTGAQAAQQFFEGKEFLGFKTSNEEYVTRLYTTFMGREADKEGLVYWTDILKRGVDRHYVLRCFADSAEYTEICQKFGIERGRVLPILHSVSEFISDPRWANGVAFDINTHSYLFPINGYTACLAYCMDYIYYCHGASAIESDQSFYDVDQIRPGDVVEIGSFTEEGHVFVVLERDGKRLKTAEGNCDGHVRIGWCYTISGSKFAEDPRPLRAVYRYSD